MTSWKHLLLCESFYILVSLFVGAFSRCLSLPVALLSSLAIFPFRGRGFGCARSLASRCLRLCFGLVDSRAENFGRCASRLGWPHLSSLIPLAFLPFQSSIVRSNSGLPALSRVRRAVQSGGKSSVVSPQALNRRSHPRTPQSGIHLIFIS